MRALLVRMREELCSLPYSRVGVGLFRHIGLESRGCYLIVTAEENRLGVVEQCVHLLNLDSLSNHKYF